MNSKFPSTTLGGDAETSDDGRRQSKDELLPGWSPQKPKDSTTKTPGRIDEAHPLHLIAIVGGLLCLNSGWVNAVAFRGFDGGVTHVTGTSTNVGINLASQEMLGFLR